MHLRRFALLLLLVAGPLAAAERTLVREFLGINGHFTFKPELYAPVCRLVRNYHNISWDVAAPGDDITVPRCRNGVDWQRDVYGPWQAAGFEADICLQFGGLLDAENDHASWRGQADWCRRYSAAITRTFGPSHGTGAATSIEIGNEPGDEFDDAVFREVFIALATGIREADPELLVVTPTVHARAANKYAKDLRSWFADLEVLPLYDVINLHTYATLPRGTTDSPWTRSYPEDPAHDYLTSVDDAIAWRDAHAPDKRVWVTEYGYDAATDAAMERRTGWAAKLDWQDVTDRQQAQYLVRSALAFLRRDVERAYLYFFNDDDQASVHAASGLTRNHQPKPAYHAMRQFSALLGDCRFARVVREDASAAYVYAFVHGAEPAAREIWVAWSPTGTRTDTKDTHVERSVEIDLAVARAPTRVVGMASAAETSEAVTWRMRDARTLQLTVGESPCYVVWDEE